MATKTNTEEVTRTLVIVIVVALADFDVETLDFLVQRGERDVEALGGFCLVPGALLQHVGNDAAFAFFDDFEE